MTGDNAATESNPGPTGPSDQPEYRASSFATITPPVAKGLAENGTLEPRLWFHAAWAVFVRPWLWWTALRQLVRSCPPGWWRRSPFVPQPDAEYLRYRMHTAYGVSPPAGLPADVVAYLDWCRHVSRRAPR